MSFTAAMILKKNCTIKTHFHEIQKLSRSYLIFFDFLDAGKIEIFFTKALKTCGHICSKCYLTQGSSADHTTLNTHT